MKQILTKLFPYQLFLTVALVSGPKAHATEMPSQEEMRAIVAIKSAFSQGDFKEFVAHSSSIPNDSLFSSYVDTWLFRLIQQPIKNENSSEKLWPEQEIKAVLTKHENTWAAEELRRTWLQQLARNGKWDLYAQERAQLRYRPDFGVECADTLYSANQGQLVRDKLRTILTYEESLPSTCRFLIQELHEKKEIKNHQLSTRLYHLIANNQINTAQRFINSFNDTSWGKGISQTALKQATDNPSKFIKQVRQNKTVDDTSLTAAITMIATKDHNKAIDLLNDSWANKILSKHSKEWLWAYIGYRAALFWDTSAEHYFAKASNDVFSDDFFEWQLRIALLNNNMAQVVRLAEQLPQHLQQEETWQYWKAYALVSQNDLINAKSLFVQFANPFSFYGKLALEELGSSPTPLLLSRPVTAEELRQAKENKGLLRALALYDAGLTYEGFREFNLQAEQMNDRELIAAATWAKNNRLYDRAIAAADRTKNEHSLELRYLTPFKENMLQTTQKTNIDPAWAYGIIRQESRFISVARSNVGASGLMQVMPATAKYVAKKIGLDDFSPHEVNNIDVNLTLGTSYLNIISKGLDDSPVLASAGYNAGPSRPKSWRSRLGANKTIEGALFAELIPFDETRTYVKHVMSNTAVYSMVLTGRPISLKQKLGTIQGTN